MHRNTRSGYTLVEMMVTLVVLALLVTTGLPAMNRFLAGIELRAAHERLFRHLSAARLTAVTEGRRTALCPSSDGQSCSGGSDWTAGWITFVDADGNRSREPAERIIAVGRLPADVRLQTSRARRAIRFLPSGASPGSNLTFRLCHRRALPGRAIILSNQGRARSSRSEPRGGPVRCG